jgi:WXXGXW repeat (2 copies)
VNRNQSANPEVTIMLRKSLLVALLAASLGSLSLPAAARTEVDVVLNFGPPAMRHEVIPAPRHGYVWAPGYWDVRGHKHVWHKGHWERIHPGQYWHESRWVQRPNGWYLERGHWSRDADRDGIPDQRDRHPYDPNRR